MFVNVSASDREAAKGRPRALFIEKGLHRFADLECFWIKTASRGGIMDLEDGKMFRGRMLC